MLLRFATALVYGALIVSALSESVVRRGELDDASKTNPDILYVDVSMDGTQVRVGVEQEDSLQHPSRTPPPPSGAANKTIYQVLRDDPKFSRIFKLVNMTDDVTKILNDSSANVTFFAPPDWALRHPNSPKDFSQYGLLHTLSAAFTDDNVGGSTSVGTHDSGSDIGDLFEVADGYINFGSISTCNSFKRGDITKIIRAVLLYHILPTEMVAEELAKNTTRATNLTLGDGSLDGEPLRLRVGYASRIAPVLAVNIYAKIVKTNTHAANGVIHEINHPLLPPPSILESLFLLPDMFSTLTSALGRVGMSNQLDYHHNGESGGTPAVTLFAPTNKAFDKLPRKLRFYLFSPFGERALKRLLEYHIAPGFILHSDWVHNVSDTPAIPHGREDIDRKATISPYYPYVQSTYDEYAVPEWVTSVERLRGSYRWPECDDLESASPYASRRESVHPRTQILCSHGNSIRSRSVAPGLPLPSPPPPIFERNLTIPTLLKNHSLGVYVAQVVHRLPLHRRIYHTHVLVDHQQLVAAPDIVARNGAFHVVEKVLNPYKHAGKHCEHVLSENLHDAHEDDWQDWEEWLPYWAEEE